MLPIFALLVLLCVHFWRAKFSHREALKWGVFGVKTTLNNLGSLIAFCWLEKECGDSSLSILKMDTREGGYL